LLGRNQKGWKGGSECTRKQNLRHLGAGFDETRLLGLFGGLITRNRAVGVVWGLGYAKRGCLIRLGARFREIGLLASLGGSITETEVLASFRAELRKMGGVVGIMGAPVSFWPFLPLSYIRQW